MSLRTKILAAVVGLNLVVLVLAVLVLLLGVSGEAGVPADLLRAASAVEFNPGTGPKAREARAKSVALLRARPGVLAALWLEENENDPDVSKRPPRPVSGAGAPPPAADVERAIALHKLARSEGVHQIREGELLLLLAGARESDDDAADAEGRPKRPADDPRRQSLYVRWEATGPAIGRARILYFTLLAGIVLVTAAGWVLLSRHVVRPLSTLAQAAASMAGGDLSARVPTSGAGDEFDRTANAFNRMATEIGEHQGQLEDRVMQALSRVRKAEQHLAIAQRLAATGKLASGIAHEINNPLGGMRNAVRALQRGDLAAGKRAEYLELIQDGLARVEETVKKVLQFTPRTPNPQRTDLADVARRAGSLARHRMEKRSITYVERIPSGDAVAVFGDSHELTQVALNLLLNAADAIPDRDADGRPRPSGRGVVEISVTAAGDQAILSVSDDGSGMTPEVEAKCFDLFFTTKEVGEGTGLGLAVVHNIVTNHGGRIDLETAPGEGTTFRIVLPREASTGDAPPARPPAVAAAGPGRSGGGS